MDQAPIGRAPGILVGAAIAVAVIIGIVIGLGWAETHDDPVTGTATINDLAALDDSAIPCAEVFTPGRPTEQVLAANDTAPCTDPNGDILINVVVSWDCPDGTKVHQVQDYGWGRDGQTWQAPDTPEPYADCVLPGTDAQHT